MVSSPGRSIRWVAVALYGVSWCGLPAEKPKPKKTVADLRSEYLAGLVPSSLSNRIGSTVGSIWSPEGLLVDGSTDYKARSVNDIVTVVASVQTTAAQSGSVDSSRRFSTTSALTGIFGATPQATNPLFAANSSTALKGAGQTASNTAFSTDLAGQVIAVLPNGNLVVEAHRLIEMNNQHEEVVVRGVARPGDISPNNTVPSSALSSLEIELKGKGIISNSVRPLNPLTKAILWLFGF